MTLPLLITVVLLARRDHSHVIKTICTTPMLDKRIFHSAGVLVNHEATKTVVITFDNPINADHIGGGVLPASSVCLSKLD